MFQPVDKNKPIYDPQELAAASTVVIYHANCLDGFTSAWICSLFLEDAIYIPAADREKFSLDVRGKTVYIIDFSYTTAIMLKIEKEAQNLILIDHHESAYKRLGDFEYSYFDLDHSAAVLVWKFFEPQKDPPLIALLAEDRDLWRWEIRGSKLATTALMAHEFTFEKWDYLAGLSLDELINMGESIQAFKDMCIKEHVSKVKISSFEGYDVPVVNCTTSRIKSELGSLICQGWPFAVLWSAFKEGKLLCSLRSNPDGGINVAELCERHGGGGHPNAAGVIVDIKEVMHWFD